MCLSQNSAASLAGEPRQRSVYGLTAILTIGSGLLLRVLPVPKFLAKYGGDALWATVVFLGLAFIFRRVATGRIAFAALCVAWLIEFSQLYHAPWIDAIRVTLPGRLILGSVFNLPDLPAYVVGIALGIFLDRTLNRQQQTENL